MSLRDAVLVLAMGFLYGVGYTVADRLVGKAAEAAERGDDEAVEPETPPKRVTIMPCPCCCGAGAVTIHEALFAGKRLHSTRALLIRLYGVGVLDRPQRGMYVVADALRDDSTGADLWDLVADGYSTIDDIMAHAPLSRSDVSYGLSVLALAGHLRRVRHGVYEVAS